MTRVQYTLPGLVPAPATEQSEVAAGPSFRSRLRALTAPTWRTWTQLLKLDVAPAASTLSPPSRPPGVDVLDPPAQRLRWKRLLESHRPSDADEFTTTASDGASGRRRAVQRMLTLIDGYQTMQDAVIARHLSESRG